MTAATDLLVEINRNANLGEWLRPGVQVIGWGVARCETCTAPVRSLTADEAARLALADEDPPDASRLECLWCGPVGVARQHPPTGPVPVCVWPAVGEWIAW